MCRTFAGAFLTLLLLSLAACTDPDSVSGSGFTRGIDDDIFATHDAGAPTLLNLGLRSNAPLLIGRPQ